MQHVIFARDRRRKKHNFKLLMFLMAVVSIFIGIMLALQHERTVLPKKGAGQLFEEHMFVDENVELPHSVDLESGSFHGDPNYVDIEINETDEQEETEQIVEDNGATSYEDELVGQDDKEPSTIPLVGFAYKAIEFSEDITIALAQGDLSILIATQGSNENGEDTAEIEDKKVKPRHYSYTVTRDDKLRDVLEQSGLGASLSNALERKFPQLAQLQVGQQFQWGLDAEGELEYIRWLVSEKEEQFFERKAKNKFAVRKVIKKGVWRQDVVKGTITGSFATSMKSVGLSARQIQQLAAGLQGQIATTRLKKGDKFAILVKREYINGKVTDLGNVEALHVSSGNKSYYAIQADNGRFYSKYGETLGKGFARYPLTFTPKVSSQFNPRRLHPVTRRVAPHKGVDFAVPSGTPIIAPADGVVEHVAFQAGGAGRYIKLRHGGIYTTVYMHLSKPLVRVGQAVKKGDRIALSGNTGRSTGAHLHYEFHINGNPVNPMKVKLPGTSSGMSESERRAFLNKVKSIETKLKL